MRESGYCEERSDEAISVGRCLPARDCFPPGHAWGRNHSKEEYSSGFVIAGASSERARSGRGLLRVRWR